MNYNSDKLFRDLFKSLKPLMQEDKAVEIASEAYLVQNQIRPGAIIHGPHNKEIIKIITDSIAKDGWLTFRELPDSNRFAPKSNYILFMKNASSYEKYEKLQTLERLSDKSAYHIYLGNLLGYLTPQNINIRNYPEGTLSGEVTVSGSLGNFQIAPQIIVGKTKEEVETYFTPILDALNSLYRSEKIPYNVKIIITILENYNTRMAKYNANIARAKALSKKRKSRRMRHSRKSRKGKRV